MYPCVTFTGCTRVFHGYYHTHCKQKPGSLRLRSVDLISLLQGASIPLCHSTEPLRFLAVVASSRGASIPHPVFFETFQVSARRANFQALRGLNLFGSDSRVLTETFQVSTRTAILPGSARLPANRKLHFLRAGLYLCSPAAGQCSAGLNRFGLSIPLGSLRSPGPASYYHQGKWA